MAYPATRAHMRDLHQFWGGEEKDRFTDLPSELSHCILSFLNMDDLGRFACVSKKCRQLHLSTPKLTFNQFFSGDTCAKWSRMLDYLNRFLILRGDNTIEHFRIYQTSFYHISETCHGHDDDKDQLIRWIEIALRCKVEVLDIKIKTDNSTPLALAELPSSIFDSRSLKSLSVYMSKTVIKSPSTTCLSNLEYLKLAYVTVDEEFFKWISLSCKCLKELRISNVCGSIEVITIESSSLVSFSIMSHYIKLVELTISGEKLQHIHIESIYSRDGIVNIFAPNLKCLEWMGYMLNHQLGELLGLEKAKIDLQSPREDLLDDKAKEDYFRQVVEFLRCIRRIKSLTVHETTITGLLNGALMTEPFEDVFCLRIDIHSFTDELVPKMVSFFKGMPNVSTLYLSSGPAYDPKLKTDCSGYDMAYWNSQDLPFIDRLEEVTIELSRDSRGSNPIEFSRFILNHAKNLKKMVIVHSRKFAKVSLQKLKKSTETSNAKVFFHSR